MKKNFKKSDLKTGMQVELRESDKRYIVLIGTPNGDVYVELGGTDWCCLDNYTEDLTYVSNLDIDIDIVKVFSDTYTNFCTTQRMGKNALIWQREEPKPILTLDGVEYSEETLRSMIKKATS